MQYICLVGCRLPPLDGYVSVGLVLTIDVYVTTHYFTQTFGCVKRSKQQNVRFKPLYVNGHLNSRVVSYPALIIGTLRHALGHEYKPW